MFILFTAFQASVTPISEMSSQSSHSNCRYMEVLEEHIAKTKKKTQKWLERENQSLGVYEYHPTYDCYVKVSPHKKHAKALNLLEKLKRSLNVSNLDSTPTPYNTIKSVMHEIFSQEEYQNSSLCKLRKKLKKLDSKKSSCTIV